jgi:predicted HicB family RNase H-like nuclease
MNVLTYKGYAGGCEIDASAGVIFGRVLGIKDVITFQGVTVPELVQAFHDSVDDYLEFCAERGEEPDRSFSGKILFRTSSERHREIAFAAARAGVSTNAWLDMTVAGALEAALATA